MRGESRVEVAFLILLTAAYYPEFEANSELIGEAAGCSPVVVRRIYKNLKEAGLLDTKPGRYGLRLARDPEKISYLDVVGAVHPLTNEKVFGVAAPLSGTTPVSGELHAALSDDLAAALESLKMALSAKTLADLAAEIHVLSADPSEKRASILNYMTAAEKRYGSR